MNFLITQFLSAPLYFLVLRPKCLPQQPILTNSYGMIILKVKDQISHPCKTRDKIVVSINIPDCRQQTENKDSGRSESGSEKIRKPLLAIEGEGRSAGSHHLVLIRRNLMIRCYYLQS
jgi:hypothetical protein